MKLINILLAFIVCSIQSFSQADYNNFSKYYGVQINTGITFFDLQPLKDDFRYSVENFNRNYNLPLQIQKSYPANISWGANVFWYINQRASIVIGTEYTSTRAFSLYEDYAGTLDLKSEIKMYYLYAGFRFHIIEAPIVQPFMGINVGLAKTDIAMDADLNISNGLIVEKDHSENSDTGYNIEPYIGCNYNLDFVVLEFVASYNTVHLEQFLIEPNSLNLKFGVKVGVFK
jgi:hypothetical protein